MNKEVCDIGTRETLRELKKEASEKSHDISNQLQLLFYYVGVISKGGDGAKVESCAKKAQESLKRLKDINNRDTAEKKLEREFDEMLSQSS